MDVQDGAALVVDVDVFADGQVQLEAAFVGVDPYFLNGRHRLLSLRLWERVFSGASLCLEQPCGVRHVAG